MGRARALPKGLVLPLVSPRKCRDDVDDAPGGVGGDFLSLIKVCRRNGDVQGAEHLLRKFGEQSDNFSVEMMNSIIHVCTRAGDLERAAMYFNLISTSGVQANRVTYNLLINACAGTGDALGAEAWIQRMKANGIAPDQVTYGTLCKCYGRQGEMDKIEEVMSLMEAMDSQPNEYFYASLIFACGVHDPPDIARAQNAFHRMVARSLQPRSVKRVLRQVIGDVGSTKLFEGLRSTSFGMSSADRSVAPSHQTTLLRGDAAQDGSCRAPVRSVPPSLGTQAPASPTAAALVPMTRLAVGLQVSAGGGTPSMPEGRRPGVPSPSPSTARAAAVASAAAAAPPLSSPPPELPRVSAVREVEAVTQDRHQVGLWSPESPSSSASTHSFGCSAPQPSSWLGLHKAEDIWPHKILLSCS